MVTVTRTAGKVPRKNFGAQAGELNSNLQEKSALAKSLQLLEFKAFQEVTDCSKLKIKSRAELQI